MELKPLLALDVEGFAIIRGVLSLAETSRLRDALEIAQRNAAAHEGRDAYALRSLLRVCPAARALAESPSIRQLIEPILGPGCRPVRGLLFDKPQSANWLVPWHQDLTICVERRLETDGFGPWTTKAGTIHVQPPDSILQQMLAARIHLDDCPETNGALRVVPGSHAFGRMTGAQIDARVARSIPVTCAVNEGDIVLMRPLLLHASSAAAAPSHRRVIHIEFAGCGLPNGLQWAQA